MRRPQRVSRLGNPRLWPFYLAAVGLLWFAEPRPVWGAAGAVLAGAGAALRAWGAGHLVKTDALTTTGPYAYLRHPLYAGTLLTFSGFVLAAGGRFSGPVLAVGGALFFLYYLPYKDRIEGARLEQRYGPEFSAYRGAVPRLWPRLRPWHPAPAGAGEGPGRAGGGWSLERFRENHEGATLATLSVLALTLALRGVVG